MRMTQSADQFELAFEREAIRSRQRSEMLRKRAAERSRARRQERAHRRGKVSFGVLLLALAFTVVTVTIVMFETLALLMG